MWFTELDFARFWTLPSATHPKQFLFFCSKNAFRRFLYSNLISMFSRALFRKRDFSACYQAPSFDVHPSPGQPENRVSRGRTTRTSILGTSPHKGPYGAKIGNRGRDVSLWLILLLGASEMYARISVRNSLRNRASNCIKLVMIQHNFKFEIVSKGLLFIGYEKNEARKMRKRLKKNGAEKITLSILSKKPPCPGISDPLSLIFTLLLNFDWIKSPIVASIGNIIPKEMKIHNSKFVCKLW